MDGAAAAAGEMWKPWWYVNPALYYYNVIIYTKAFTSNKTNDNKTDLPVFVLAF